MLFWGAMLTIFLTASSLGGEFQQESPAPPDPVADNYGLRPEDADRIEQGLGEGAASPARETVLARRKITTPTTTSVPVSFNGARSPVVVFVAWPILLLVAVTTLLIVWGIRRGRTVTASQDQPDSQASRTQ